MIHLVKPSRGHVTQRYANTQPDGLPHAGQDYAYTNGKEIFPEVYAASDGVVQFAGDSRNLGWPNPWYVNPDFNRADNWDSSAGNLITIRHKQFSADTGYGHLEKCFVKAGDTVKAGQVIGIAGETGNSRGKHLHFFLMFHPFNYATSTYGCSDPNPYFIGSASAEVGTIQLQSTSTITPIAPIQEDEVSAEDVFNKKLTLKNGAESTFENQVLNISDDLSKVLKRQEEDRQYAQAVNGKLDGIVNLIAALPAEVLQQKVTTVDGRETTLETEVKWLPKNFQALQGGGQA